jgi:hypothetical protein
MPRTKPKLVEIKTKPATVDVTDFIQALPDEQKRNDNLALLEMMQQASGESPVLWSNSIVGFGLKRYESPASGRQVDWFQVGFAPRKNLTAYLIDMGKHETALPKLGKYKTGGGCLYLNKLADVNLEVLRGMIMAALVP